MVVESGGVGGFCPVIWLKSFASLELLASLNDGKLVPSNCLEHRCTISALIGTNAIHESTSNIDDRVPEDNVQLLAAMHNRWLVFLRRRTRHILPDSPQLYPALVSPTPPAIIYNASTHAHTPWTDKAESRVDLTEDNATCSFA